MKMGTWLRSSLAAVMMVCGAGAAHATIDNPQQGIIRQSGVTLSATVCGDSAPDGIALCHAQVVVDASGTPVASPDLAPAPAGYGPADLRSAYGHTALGSAATTIAIVDAYGYPNAEADLAVYRAKFGLPPCTKLNGCFKKVNQRGQPIYPAYVIGWAQETALDLDMASAMCPNCKILLVQADSNSFADLATAENMAASLGAKVISNSFGGRESSTQISFANAYNHPGVAITVSSGDGSYSAGPQSPASFASVIAVGGTRLVKAATSRGWDESAWTGAGSGCSGAVAKPAWQSDGLCAKRMIADISAVADPATGVAVYGPSRGTQAAWLVFGGTSVSAPLIGGIYGALGIGVSNASKIYSVAGTAALNDVTTGNNGSCGGTYFCTAVTGYDGPTGNGTPYGPGAF